MIVEISKPAFKSLNAMARADAARIYRKIETYAANPKALANQVKKLKGSGYLRLRVGGYRVVFTEDGKVMTIIKAGHRRDIYD